MSDFQSQKQAKVGVRGLYTKILTGGESSGVDEGLENGGEIYNWDVDLDENGVEGAGHTANSLHEVPNNEKETGIGRF